MTALSPDGRILAAGGEVSLGLRGLLKKDYAIRLWEVASGREIGRLEGLADATITLAFSPDSRMLASAGATGRKGEPDHPVHLWDLTTLRELRRFDGHRNHINRVAISPDGRWLASASEDATVLVWDLASVDVPELGAAAEERPRPALDGAGRRGCCQGLSCDLVPGGGPRSSRAAAGRTVEAGREGRAGGAGAAAPAGASPDASPRDRGPGEDRQSRGAEASGTAIIGSRGLPGSRARRRRC